MLVRRDPRLRTVGRRRRLGVDSLPIFVKPRCESFACKWVLLPSSNLDIGDRSLVHESWLTPYLTIFLDKHRCTVIAYLLLEILKTSLFIISLTFNLEKIEFKTSSENFAESLCAFSFKSKFIIY